MDDQNEVLRKCNFDPFMLASAARLVYASSYERKGKKISSHSRGSKLSSSSSRPLTFLIISQCDQFLPQPSVWLRSTKCWKLILHFILLNHSHGCKPKCSVFCNSFGLREAFSTLWELQLILLAGICLLKDMLWYENFLS